ncbi:MAG TPA: potassium-transporting ATPase subunit C [Thermoplasmata archaeon]|nr:potassium-transporting ATPase subunit C [Thermoplasmata archaeon]
MLPEIPEPFESNGAEVAPAPEAPPPPVAGRAVRSPLRASMVFVALLILMSGAAYPGLIREAAKVLSPATAGGSLVTCPNGSAWGSSLLGENVTSPALFWLRPSMIDDQAFTGAGNEVPYGPTDPNLVNLTRYYIALYGLNNTSVPLDVVAPTASGLDPYVTPAGVLVQVPRVAAHSGLPQAWLTSFVSAHIVEPLAGFFGPAYVNVLALDHDLVPHLPPGAAPTFC